MNAQGRMFHIRGQGRRRPLRWGGAVLEAAFVLPVLLLLSFGTVEYGYYFYVRGCLQAAARSGARVAIIPSATNAQVQSAINNAMANTGLASGDWTWSVTDASGTAVDVANTSGGTDVQVVVQATWGVIGVHPLGLISSSRVLSGRVVMRKEGFSS